MGRCGEEEWGEGGLGMLDYYASRAPYYDAVYEKPERGRDLAFLKKFLPQQLTGKSTLEVACGTGFWTQYIAPHCPTYTATDAIPEPMAYAQARTGVAHVTFSIADAYALPESLGVFDAAFAGLWFSHIPIGSVSVFLASLHARLRPGARVMLIDNGRSQCVDFPIVETDKMGNTYQRRTLKDGVQHRVLKNFPTENALTQMVSAVSSRVAYRELEHFWMFQYDLK